VQGGVLFPGVQVGGYEKIPRHPEPAKTAKDL